VGNELGPYLEVLMKLLTNCSFFNYNRSHQRWDGAQITGSGEVKASFKSGGIKTICKKVGLFIAKLKKLDMVL